jgi:hypothetical protein
VETSSNWGQPGRTPEGRALDEVRLVPVARVAGSGNSKIGQLDQAVERDQNIGGLDVPVMKVMIVAADGGNASGSVTVSPTVNPKNECRKERKATCV